MARSVYTEGTVLKSLGVFVFMMLFLGMASREEDSSILNFVARPEAVSLYWKNDNGEILGSLYRLKSFIESKGGKLKFAMNGGMYMTDQRPLGLYIEDGEVKSKLNTASPANGGNFYLMPNGVFYITTDNRAVVCKTADIVASDKIRYATQSGPMLLIDGEMHPAFIQGSKNLNIRNGVGILPDGSVVFAMSKNEINFYDFATFFKQLNCKNALYLDGFVSRTYFPEEKWEQLDGNFGVLIGVTE